MPADLPTRPQQRLEFFLSVTPEEAEILEAEAERLGFGSVAATIKELCGLPFSQKDRRRSGQARPLLRRPGRLLNNGRVRIAVGVSGDQVPVLEAAARRAKESPGVWLKGTALRAILSRQAA